MKCTCWKWIRLRGPGTHKPSFESCRIIPSRSQAGTLANVSMTKLTYVANGLGSPRTSVGRKSNYNLPSLSSKTGWPSAGYKSVVQVWVASCTAWLLPGAKEGSSGRQWRREVCFTIWCVELSIGGALFTSGTGYGRGNYRDAIGELF